jgi:hypothetical protein
MQRRNERDDSVVFVLRSFKRDALELTMGRADVLLPSPRRGTQGSEGQCQMNSGSLERDDAGGPASPSARLPLDNVGLAA